MPRSPSGAQSSQSDESEPEIDEYAPVLDVKKLSGLRKWQMHFWLLFEDSTYSLTAEVVQATIMLLILLSVVIMLIQSVTYCRWDDDGVQPLQLRPRICDERPTVAEEPIAFWIIETICIAGFTLEYLLRLFGCPATIGLFAFLSPLASPMNVVDLAAIVPYYVELPERISVLQGAGSDGEPSAPTWLSVVRLVRIVRIMKVAKSITSFRVLTQTVGRSLIPLLMLVVFFILLCVLFASLIYVFERGDFREDDDRAPLGYWYAVDEEPTKFASIWDGWYWCVQTLTSEGYGDIYPLTAVGKFFGTIAALLGIVVLALPITIIGTNFDDEYAKSLRWDGFAKKSRVLRYRYASRNGTRPVPSEAYTWRFWRGRQPTPSASDPRFCDQARARFRTHAREPPD